MRLGFASDHRGYKLKNELMKFFEGEYGLLDVFAGAMTHDTDYSYYLSYGTNGKQNIVYAFNKANELFNENLK